MYVSRLIKRGFICGINGQPINNHFRREKNQSLTNRYIHFIKYFVFLHVIALCTYYFLGMYIEPRMVHLGSDFSKDCFSLCCFYIVALFLYLYCWHVWDFSGQCCTDNPNRISRSFSFIVVYLSFCCGKEMTDRAPDEPYSIICDPEVINRVGLTNRAGRSSLTRFVTGVRVKIKLFKIFFYRNRFLEFVM